MQTKTYFANNVPAALEVARQELGPDALLLNSRPAPEEMKHFGRLEVTFAWDQLRSETAAGDKPEAGSPVVTMGMQGSQMGVRSSVTEHRTAEPRSSELEDIRRQLSALRVALGRPGERNSEPQDDPMAVLLAERLIHAGLSAELCREIAQMVCSDGGAARGTREEQAAVERELVRRVPTGAFAEIKSGESRTLALIGPPGRGKTTTLVKLAIRLGLSRRIPVRIYSAGVHGVGGREQMARYAAILGVPQQSFESFDALNLAMTGDVWRGLILIDTQGFSPAENNELTALAAFCAGRPEIEKHLVLRADARLPEMTQTVKRFAGLQPTRLLFTGLDESTSLGAMFETLIRAGIPTAFAGTGPRIPDDLQDVDIAVWARRVREASDGAGVERTNTRAARAAA